MLNSGSAHASRPLSVCFLRPRLGIGGAERLVVDAAVELQRRGHRVRLIVADVSGPQFPPVANGQLAVQAGGRLIPNHIGQRVRLPLAIAQMAYGASVLARRHPHPDAIVCDVAPHVIPFLKRVVQAPVLYCCNFPDLLLTRDRRDQPSWYRWYRRPLDRRELRGLLAADRIVVTSRFTGETLRATFPQLAQSAPSVLYPGVDPGADASGPVVPSDHGAIEILSISRFDPKKNLPLAIEALACARPLLPDAIFRRVTLVLAGRYDARLAEQRQVREALERLTRERQLSGHVRFVLSPADPELRALLARCRCVLYAPEAEHFGYVPLEAMVARRPVVAANVGGPTETVRHGETGLLCPATPEAFGQALATVILDDGLARRLGDAGRDRVARHFSLDAFGERLEGLLERMTGNLSTHSGLLAV